LVSWAPVVIEGTPVGKIALVVSTDRLTSARRLLNQSSRATLLGGLAALLVGFAVVLFFARAVGIRDAQLSDYAATLERKVEERTQQLDERNQGMRLVLDNVAQGFLTIDSHGVMAAERSRVVEEWLGPSEPGATLPAFLATHDEGFAKWLSLGLTELKEALLPTELVLDQIPKHLSVGNRIIEIAYRPIGVSETPERLLVVMTDVTDQLARERAEREQRELVAMFQHISVDRQGVEDFIREGASLVDALRNERAREVQLRLIHTLKGNCGMYGLEMYAATAHSIESELAETSTGVSEEQRVTLVGMWKEAIARVGRLLGSPRRDVLEITVAELTDALERVRAGAPGNEITLLLEEWTREPVSRRFDRLSRQARSLARRLAKPEPQIEITSNGLRLDARVLSPFWNALVHVVRNAVDHGIEDDQTRTASGKPTAGKLEFVAQRSAAHIVLEVRDDGRGVAWEEVRSRAVRFGLPSESRDDLVLALLSDGMTTRESVSDVSGRGVGLAAVAQTVNELSGTIEVDSQSGVGTTFRFRFPAAKLLTPDDGRARSIAPLSSLLPNVL
jgi:two-component system chemotaxis sensor kinase CheA